MTYARQRLGRRAEQLVAERLRRSGWRIVDRNARLTTGELDLVALDGATLVFVEVKAGRAGALVGPERPAHAVGPRKQAKLRTVALGGDEAEEPERRVAGGVELVPRHRGHAHQVVLGDPMVTNVCFGGDDLRTAFATLSGTGRLVSFAWPRPGLQLAF